MKSWMMGQIEARACLRNLNYINIPCPSYLKILDKVAEVEQRLLDLYDKFPSISIVDIAVRIGNCEVEGSHRLLFEVDAYTVRIDIAYFKYTRLMIPIEINRSIIAPRSLLGYLEYLSKSPSMLVRYAKLIEKYDYLCYDSAAHNLKDNKLLAEKLIPVYKDYPTIIKYLKGLASLTPNR